MRGRKRRTRIICFLLAGLLGLTSCGSPSSASLREETFVEEALGREISSLKEEGKKGLIYEGSMELSYAENFSVDYYQEGIRGLTTMDGTKLLVIPEGVETPEEVSEDWILIKQPVKNLYLVSSAVMDMFQSLNSLSAIGFSAQKAEGWYVASAREAMEEGNILYAGKYNKPDYELIVSKGCSLAIENRMITHSPEVKEMLESFGIPVMIEYSSAEAHPLGRVEWIKFFGALLGKEEEAKKAFAVQEEILKNVEAKERTDLTVGFFYVTANGMVQVRQSNDYIPKLITLAGGRYIFDDLDEGDGRSTLSMQVEEFYLGAKDADFLIYNSSIDGGVDSLEGLIDKCEILKDCKAVQEGKVFCTTNDLYQQSMSIGYLLQDIHTMLQGGEESSMKYLFQLQ